MNYNDLEVMMIAGDQLSEVVRLGDIENVEIVNQAKRIFGGAEDLLWESKKCHVEKGDIVVEIGACIGLFSLRAGLQGAKRIVLFEPNDPNRYCATYNANLGFASRRSKYPVRVINAAVCDYEGVAPFFDVPAIGQHGMFKLNRAVDARQIKTMTLNSLFRKRIVTKIDFLKCDGNGAETLIFDGISNTNLKKIRKLSVQYHHHVEERCSGWRKSFLARLKKLGYNIETGPRNSWNDDWIRAWRS